MKPRRLFASGHRIRIRYRGCRVRFLIVLLAAAVLSSGCATIQYGGRHGYEVELRTETTSTTPGTVSPSNSFGVEVEYTRGKVNSLLGPNEIYVLPTDLFRSFPAEADSVSEHKHFECGSLDEFEAFHQHPGLGWGWGIFAGYAATDGRARDGKLLMIDDIARGGVSLMLLGSNSAAFSGETIAATLGVKAGLAIAERGRFEAPDLVGITRHSYAVVAPEFTVRTPLRLRLGERWSVIVSAGGETSFYVGGDEQFRTVSIRLGVFLFDRRSEGFGLMF